MTPTSFIASRLLFVLAAVAVLATAVVATTTVFRAEAATFNPGGSACLDDENTVDPDLFNPGSPNECDGNNAPGANSSITTSFGVPAGDSNFGGVVAFTPPEWGVARDADIEDGTLVSRLNSQAVLGLLNGQCATALPVSFDLLEATTDQSDTVLFNEPNKAAAFDKEQFEEINGIPRGVTEYPDYLLRALWGADEGTPLQPISRLYGQTNVSGVAVSLNFAILEPGATIRGDTVNPKLGYPSVTLLNNGGDPDIKPAPSAITDFCSPLATSTTTFGNPDGQPFRTNPTTDGTYNFVVYTQSLRDADNDGWENSLDTCPYDANHPNWNPRLEVAAGVPFPGDGDRDGIPDECDPLPTDQGNPDGGAFNDHDGDNYYNRQDNCPLVRNNLGIAFIIQGGTNNQGDADSDGIGDDCDNDINVEDGERTIKCVVTEVVIGAGGTPGFTDYFPCGTRTDISDPGAPTPTLPPGATPRPASSGGTTSGGSTGGGVGGPDTGIGSLAPNDGNLPLWALGLAGVAVLGLLTGGMVLTRDRTRTRDE